LQAVQRDLKNYIAKHSDRTIPVGYSAADVREILEDTWAYLQCNHDEDKSRSDFFGLNSYSWCGGDATFETAGYNLLVDMFKNSTIPVFFSEYGCNKVMPRVFNEVQALYGSEMTSMSGGLVYEYSLEESDYGLVQINDNTTVTLLKDYDNLQDQYNKLDISLIQATNPSATQLTAPDCSSDLISNSGFEQDFDIPDLPEGGEDLINNGIDNPVNGKLVEVKETNVPMAAYGSTGVQIQNLAIRLLANDESNTPGGENTSPSTTGGATPTPSKKGSASTLSVDTTCGILLFSVFMSVLTFL
jgi:hypothetical protein